MKERAPYSTVVHNHNLHILEKAGELAPDDVDAFQFSADADASAKKSSATSSKIQASGSATVLIPGTSYVQIGIENKAYELSEAKKLLPPRPGCYFLALHKNTSWMVKAPGRTKTPKSQSVLFNGDWSKNRGALIDCLKWAWAVDKEVDPSSTCPFHLI